MLYAYMRCSTSTQMERNGIQMQQEEIKKYCMANDLTVDGVFVDEGISGTKEDRDGLFDLLQALDKGDKVIVQNTSRLWRADSVKVFVHKELKRKGCDIISVENPSYSLYTVDPNDFLFNSIMEILDQYERMTIALKLQKGRKAKAKRGGKPCGVAPYGYKWDGNRIVAVYPQAFTVVAMYNEFYEKGKISAVKRMLDESGEVTNRGKAFSLQAIKNILTNPFYMGVLTYAGGEIEGDHEAIIGSDLWIAVNERID